MERWEGRVAVVTGASAGIGAAVAYQLQDAGMHVVALARRADKIPSAVQEARSGAESRGRSVLRKSATPGKLHCLKCDVSKEEDILKAFQWVKANVGGVDILVNNAGVVGEGKLYEAPTEELKAIMDINVMGLSICTREAIQLMKANGVDDGHIVNIGSICGFMLPNGGVSAMYFASKHAVRVLSEGLRKELVQAKSGIRITEISPGSVKTDVLNNMKTFTAEMRFKDPFLWSEDIADVLLYAVSAPKHVQIHEVIIVPTGETM